MSMADTTSQVETVFRRLLGLVIEGTYPEGTRLPAERTLCEALETSRGTLREALRRLGDWNVVETRQGSGATVLPRADWLFDVLPAYLAFKVGHAPVEDTLKLLSDLLDAQRDIHVAAMSIAARLAKPEKLEQSKVLLEKAWAVRADTPAFMRAEFELFHSLIASTDFLPGQWLMNRIGGVFYEIAILFGTMMQAPDDFVAYYSRLIALLEAHDEAGAAAHVRETMTQFDALVLAQVEQNLKAERKAS